MNQAKLDIMLMDLLQKLESLEEIELKIQKLKY